MKPKGVIIHYFSAKNVDKPREFDLDACRDLMIDLNSPREFREHYLKDPKSPASRMYASAHIFIARDGETWKLVDFDKQAYHAGHSIMNDQKNCNAWTLGVELIGTITSGFTDDQYIQLAKLLVVWMDQFEFSLVDVAGHDTVRNAAILDGQTEKKKYDPSGKSDGKGDNFDWPKLYNYISLEMGS